MKDGWWSLVLGEHHFLSVLGEHSSMKLESSTWRCQLSFDNDYDRQRNQSDFKMVCYDCLFLIGCGEQCFDLDWEWREARVWRECPVTRICTYTWTSRWSFVCLNEVLGFEVKSYSKSFELWLWAAYRMCSDILWVVRDEVVLAVWCSSSWLCMIYITAE